MEWYSRWKTTLGDYTRQTRTIRLAYSRFLAEPEVECTYSPDGRGGVLVTLLHEFAHALQPKHDPDHSALFQGLYAFFLSKV